MALIRHRDGSEGPKKPKVGVKKMASVIQQNQGKSQLNLHPGPKTTLVSGIVDQLIKSGYKGDLMSSAGMTYNHPDVQEAYIAEDQSQNELQEDMIVDDIDFNSSQTTEKQKTEGPKKEAKKMSAAEIRKRNAAFFEERTKNSQDQIEMVAKNARNLYGHIDSFISSLREAADQTRDNQRLGIKLENLRRLCIGFVRTAEQQMPNYSTSLFVNAEENKNGQR